MTAIQITHVEITTWRDGAVEAHGYPPHTRAFSRLWTPLLGPAATAIFRTLTDLSRDVTHTVVTIDTIAASIGLGPKKGRVVVHKALERLEHHNLIRMDLPLIAVRRCAPPLSARHRRSFPALWQHQLEAEPLEAASSEPPRSPAQPGKETDQPPPAPAGSAQQRRIALSLLKRGTNPEQARQRLAHWGANADEAAAVIAWALHQPDFRVQGEHPDRDWSATSRVL